MSLTSETLMKMSEDTSAGTVLHYKGGFYSTLFAIYDETQTLI